MSGKSVLLVGWLLLQACLSMAEPAVITPVDGEPELVLRLQREGRVDARAPAPDLRQWLVAVTSALGRWVQSLIGDVPALRNPEFWRHAGYAAIVLAIAALAAGLWYLLLWLGRRADARDRDIEAIDPAGTSRQEASFWWRLFEQELMAGRARLAAGALWWWLAASLQPQSEVPASMTSRQLLARAQRPDLGLPVGRLDRILYGPDSVEIGDVRALAAELRGGLE